MFPAFQVRSLSPSTQNIGADSPTERQLEVRARPVRTYCPAPANIWHLDIPVKYMEGTGAPSYLWTPSIVKVTRLTPGSYKLSLMPGRTDRGIDISFDSGDPQLQPIGVSVIQVCGLRFLTGGGGIVTAKDTSTRIGPDINQANNVTIVFGGDSNPPNNESGTTGLVMIRGMSAKTNAVTNFVGGAVSIVGGAGASAATTQAAHGGTVAIAGGPGYGTGTKGKVTISRAITSGQGFATGAKSADYTFSLDDCDQDFDCTATPLIGTLPPVASVLDGQRFMAVKVDATGNSLTFDASGSETINGAASVSTSTQYGVLRVKPNAGKTAWIQW